MKKIVFFDLDGTILPNPSSEKRFFFWLLRHGYIGWKQLWSAFKYSLFRMVTFKNHIFVANKAYLRGLSEDMIKKLAVLYSEQYLIPIIRLHLQRYVEEHLHANDKVILMTATLEYIADAIAQHLNITEVIATKCKVKDGTFCGFNPLQLPYDKAKLLLAEKACSNYGMALNDAVAYANSNHDLFLLNKVGKPIAVTPDRKLCCIAKSRKWDIVQEMPR